MENINLPQEKAKKAETVQMIAKEGKLEISHLPQVYIEFKKPIDPKGLQQSLGDETHKGYDTLGYGYAWITERLNDVVGFCWRVVEKDEKYFESKSELGKLMHSVSVDIVIQLGNWVSRQMEFDTIVVEENEKDKTSTSTKAFRILREFEVLAETPIGNGWNKSLNVADARKGARTNGLKKAAAFFGIGNDAYQKLIDEENQIVKEELNRKRKGKKIVVTTAPASSATPQNLMMIKQKLLAMGHKTHEAMLFFLANTLEFSCTDLNKLNDKQQRMVLAKIMQYEKQVLKK